MSDTMRKPEILLQFSPEREKRAWEHLASTYVDRFSAENGTVDVDGLKGYLNLLFGSLFPDQAGQFASLLATVTDRVDTTREGLISIMSGELEKLRKGSYPDYPSFEEKLRRVQQELRGFVPLIPNRMICYKIEGEYVWLHVLQSYSVAKKGEGLDAAIRALSEKLEQPEFKSVTTIAAESWLIEKLFIAFEEFGFVRSQDPKRPKLAFCSLEKFKIEFQKWADNQPRSIK